ncbi:MAG: hypothetical protein ACYSTS_07715 [Planctomycetota bacterium]
MLHRFKDARDRGCAYLLTKRYSGGGFGIPEMGVADYYKTLLAFGVCGQNNAASQLCEWIRANGITSLGDFGPRPEDFGDFRYTYPNSWVIIGAHRLGNFDLSQKGMDFLMGFWDSESGGFYSSSVKHDADTEQDLIYVSFCGYAAINTGRIEVARAVGKWMQTFMKAQPNFPQKLYTVYSRARGLYIGPDIENEIRYIVSRDATRYQNFFQPGAAAAFLTSLFQTTGEKQWLELAKEFMRFAEGASDYLFNLLAAGKVGWAASLLYKLTRENKYREMAIRIGDNIIAAQSKKGYWDFPGTNTPDNSITAEMVVWLDAIHQAAGNE